MPVLWFENASQHMNNTKLCVDNLCIRRTLPANKSMQESLVNPRVNPSLHQVTAPVSSQSCCSTMAMLCSGCTHCGSKCICMTC
jgi:hypothetical protein